MLHWGDKFNNLAKMREGDDDDDYCDLIKVIKSSYQERQSFIQLLFSGNQHRLQVHNMYSDCGYHMWWQWRWP